MKRNWLLILGAALLTTVGVVSAQTVLNYDQGGAKLLQISSVGNGAAVQPSETDVSLTLPMSRFNSYTINSSASASIVAVPGAAYQLTGITSTVTLPDATLCKGQSVYVKNNHGSSNSDTVSPHGGQTVAGGSSVTLTNGQSGEFISDGANFQQL